MRRSTVLGLIPQGVFLGARIPGRFRMKYKTKEFELSRNLNSDHGSKFLVANIFSLIR